MTRKGIKNSNKRKLDRLEQQKRYRKKYPEKGRARLISSKAVLSGELVKKSCEVCGDNNTEIHHLDYSKPLNVMFLCKFHHEEWHNINGDFV